MGESEPRRHPLFDPDSTYGRMRACVRAEGKIWGYFHWMAARAERIAPQASVSADLPDGKPPPVVSGPASRANVLAAMEAQPCLVLFVAAPGVDILRDDGVGYLQLVREGDGTASLDLMALAEEPFSRGSACCRAFLLEPEVVSRLAEATGQDAISDRAWDISQVLQTDAVVNNLEVARILSAVPDLDGEVKPDGTFSFQRVRVRDGFVAFPARTAPLTVVIVIEDTEPWTANREETHG